MATIVTDKTSDYYVPNRGLVISNAGSTDAPFVLTDTCIAGPAGGGKVQIHTADLTLTIIPVYSVGNTNTLATGLRGLVAVAWQGDDVDVDEACVYVSDVDTGTVYFDGLNPNMEGYIWCLHRN
jgi:hypothetical protein